jgi:hypothetical protein
MKIGFCGYPFKERGWKQEKGISVPVAIKQATI